MYRYRSTPTRAYVVLLPISLVLAGGFCAAQEDGAPEVTRESTAPIRPFETAAEKRIREVLDELTTLDVIDAPLDEVLRYFETLHHIEIEIDARALLDWPLERELLVTSRLDGVSLRSALDLILSELDLAYLIDSEVLQVTTYHEAGTRFQTVLYPVFDLLAPIEDESVDVGDASDYQQLIDLINLNVKIYDGTRAIRGYHGSLIIRETEEAHRQISELLQALRQYQARDNAMSNHVPIRVGETEANSAIRAKLLERTTLDFVDTPLVDVLKYLGDYHGLQIKMNRTAIDDIGVDTTVPITRKLTNVSLRSALELMLAELDLALLIEPGMLVVTSIEEYEDHQSTVIYPAADLMPLTENNLYDHDELSDMIYTFVDPTSWPEGTGPGAIREFCGAIIFTQMEEAHRHTIELLQGLRKLKSASPAE